MFVDRDLAQRLERTEGTVGASFVDARNAMSSIGAEWRDFGGTTAVFDGVDSPLTQTFGLGFAPADLGAIEAFFTERGADTMHEVSPFGGVELMAELIERGYRPLELSTVLVQELVAPPPASPFSVRVIDPAVDGEAWIETSVNGWSSEPEVVAFIRSLTRVNVQNRAMTHYLVEADGEAIATGSMGVHDGIALLAGASTLPAARGRGAQNSLLGARLVDARARGCTVAMMVSAVGSTSQRNAQRNGFRVAYTRTKWRRHQV